MLLKINFRCFFTFDFCHVYSSYSYYAREIQRLYRAHLVRKAVRKEFVDTRYAALIDASRHYAAVVIQRYFKGYYSRQHLHDFYARKAYIQAIALKGEQLRQELDIALAVQLNNQLAEQEAKAREEFDKTTQRLHHLVSTKVQPGVYNPPYAQNLNQVPSAFGIPLETHIQVGNVRYLRTNGLYPTGGTINKTKTTNNNNDLPLASTSQPVLASTFTAMGEEHVTLVPAYVHPTDKRTLQSMAPYDAPLIAARKEARIQKLLALDQKPFIAGSKSQILEPHQTSVGVHAAVPFTESWLLSRSTRDLEHLEQKDKRITDRPYIPASSRSSKLFEDTERKRTIFANALITGVTTTNKKPNPLDTTNPLSLTIDVNNQTKYINPTNKEHIIPSLTATVAGVGGGATSIVQTTTIRQGNQLIKVKTIEEMTQNNNNTSISSSTNSKASSTNNYPVGSAAAAVRRARQNTNNNQDSTSDNELQSTNKTIPGEARVPKPGFPTKPPPAIQQQTITNTLPRPGRPVMKPPVAIK